MRAAGLALCVMVLAAGSLPGGGKKAETKPELVPLWPEGAPGAMGKAEKDIPGVFVYLPAADKATGAAVVICPGGGYGGLAMSHEGHDIARWLNSLGVAGIICKYRVAPYRHPVEIQDAQRALRTTRSKAKEWGIDVNRVGILGFSAGGHLALTAGTRFDKGKADAADPIDRQSCRPDFMVLCYPVIRLSGPFAHVGSKNNLLGPKAEAELVESLCNDTQVTKETPPTFLLHTSEDKGVPPENSVLFYMALQKHGVPAQMHIYEKGQHGLGLGPAGLAYSSWPGECAAWMKGRGLLGKDQ